MRMHRAGPAYAPLAVPVPPPPPVRRSSPAAVALAILAAVLGIGIVAVVFVVSIAAAVLAEIGRMEATSAAASTPTPPTVVAIDRADDDCAAAALRSSHSCEDISCFATVGAELRTCLARPEQEARACNEVPDPSLTGVSAQWMTTRCSFEASRDQNDCIRLMSIVQDHCANVDARERGNAP